MKHDGYISKWRETQVDGLHVCRQAEFGSCGQSQSRTDSGPQARQARTRHRNAPGATGTFQRFKPWRV